MRFAARRRHALIVAACLSIAAPAMAQEAPAEMLEEFIHYTLIAKPDLAASWGQRLMESVNADSDLAEILDENPKLNDRFDEALDRAHRVPELKDVAAELDRRVSDGRLDLARNPKRIEKAISMLTGTQRMRLHAHQMLAAAGEYAVPRLLLVVTEGKDERMRTAAGNMLVEIARLSVTPLCTALPDLDDRNQRFICRVLGEIKLPHAAPFLMEMALDEKAAAATREAALRAFRLVGGVQAELTTLYERLGQQYFNEAESLIAYPYEPTNNVWSYDPQFGLALTPVPTEIYSEVMAMRMAGKSLGFDPQNRQAVSLFVAANLRRENELVPGAADPIYGENRYSPAFYATVFGTQICLDVLAIGLDRLDTQLVRDAIAALAQTTGGANLFTADTGRQPLLEAIRYPDRRVQYEAALTLARALPEQRFAGDVNVVPLLGSAVRTGDESFAVVIAGETEDQRVLTSRLEALGFTIVAAGPTFDAVRTEVALAVGVDLIAVSAGGVEPGIVEIGEAHVNPKTAATPVLIVAAPEDMPQLKQHFRDDIRVKVTRNSDEGFSASLDEVMERAAGGRMTEAEAEGYAIDAIMALRDIAISHNTAYAIADAEGALIGALASRQGALRLSVADILALMSSSRAQQVLFDAALTAAGDEQIALLDRVADSVKRFGNLSEPRQMEALLALVVSSGGGTAEAAARLHGALDLPPAAAIELIPRD